MTGRLARWYLAAAERAVINLGAFAVEFLVGVAEVLEARRDRR